MMSKRIAKVALKRKLHGRLHKRPQPCITNFALRELQTGNRRERAFRVKRFRKPTRGTHGVADCALTL
jgi:hypothetical protein